MADFAYDLDAQKRIREIEKKIAGGGPPPDNDGMNTARILKLEEFADSAKQQLARFETKIDHIEKEVSQVKWLIVVQILAGIATVAGTGIAIQQMTVSTFQAAGAQAQPVQQQPIIINVPQAAPASSPAPAH